MSWDEVKNEKEGYLRVRKSDDRALIGRLKKENDDKEAKGYIELKVDDLGGLGGSGGGPHTHTEYANKVHSHDEYLTELPDHDHPHTHDEYLTALPDHTHPEYEGGSGESYDDTEVRDLIQANADSIAEIQTKGYDDTELSGRVSDTETKNTQQDGRLGSLEAKQSSTDEDIADLYALADKKADTDHTHDAPEGMVTSDSVTSIVRLSQTEFDALADKDASTLYLVV